MPLVLNIHIHGTNHVDTKGTLVLRSYSLGQRMLRGAKRLAICWSIAVVSVIIPVLHFLLVPGFFICGLVVFVLALRETERVRSGEGICPGCGKPFPIPEQRSLWPLQLSCNNCGQFAWVEREECYATESLPQEA